MSVNIEGKGERGAVELQNVTKRFGSMVAVDGLNLAVKPGEFLSLLGPSGCGKTTTLRMLAGFEQPDEGHIRISGQYVQGIPPYKRDVNTVFQAYALFPHMSVAENVGYGLRQKGVPKHEIVTRVAEALDMVKMSKLAERKPRQMSGGQQQRVAVARALVNRPSVLLLDEPLGALDRPLRARLVRELRDLFTELSLTVLAVTHDQPEAFALADRLVLLDAGRVLQTGPPAEVWARPASVRSAELLGFANIGPFPGEVDGPPVLVRADGVHVGAEGPLPAVVRSVTFAGPRSRVVLALASGRPLEADVPTPLAPLVGTTVGVRIDADAVISLPP